MLVLSGSFAREGLKLSQDFRSEGYKMNGCSLENVCWEK